MPDEINYFKPEPTNLMKKGEDGKLRLYIRKGDEWVLATTEEADRFFVESDYLNTLEKSIISGGLTGEDFPVMFFEEKDPHGYISGTFLLGKIAAGVVAAIGIGFAIFVIWNIYG